MKRIILGGLTLLVAVSAYYYVQNYVQTPEPAALGSVVPTSEPPEKLSPTTPTNGPAASQTEMSSTPTEQSALDEKALRIAAALERFGDLRGRALMDALKEDPLAKGIGAEILLAMVEAGYLDSNESIFASGEFGTHSPVYVAILITEGELSTEYFQRFLDLGAQVATDDDWLNLMAFSELDKGVVELWYEAAAVGPELHQQLINYGLYDGSLVLSDLIMNDKGGRYDSLTYSGDFYESTLERLTSYQSITDEQVEDFYQQVSAYIAEGQSFNIFYFHESSIRRAELLINYGNLPVEQRQRVQASREALKTDLQRLKARFAQ